MFGVQRDSHLTLKIKNKYSKENNDNKYNIKTRNVPEGDWPRPLGPPRIAEAAPLFAAARDNARFLLGRKKIKIVRILSKDTSNMFLSTNKEVSNL